MEYKYSCLPRIQQPDTISTYVVNATKGSQTNIRTALWALSTIIFLIVVIVEVVMNFAPIKNEAQKEKH